MVIGLRELNMKDILIVGDSGLAHEVCDWAQGLFNVIGFTTFDGKRSSDCRLPGKIYSDEEVTTEIAKTDAVILGIGSPKLRLKLVQIYKKKGFNFPKLLHPSAVIAKTAKIEEGVVVAPMCVISNDVNLGAFTYVNFCVGIGHNTIIYNYVQINPGCQIGGNVSISNCSLLGAGSIIRQGLNIAENVTIGSGSVVFHSLINKNITVMGNPAKRMRSFEG